MLTACGSDTPGGGGPGGDDDDDTENPGGSSGAQSSSGSASTTLADELPWEVVTEQGETVLPFLFYAEPSQNEQVMPHTVDGHAQINRLVYPTFGNPNLFLRDDDKDSLLVVLRVEESAYDQLAPTLGGQVPGKQRSYLELTQDVKNHLAVWLVPRGGRAQYTALSQVIPGGNGNSRLFPITPSEIQLDPIADDQPESLSRRRTLRLIFRKDALANVPADLYDLRFELLQDGRAAVGDDASPVVEWQYNAVRIYDDSADEYEVLNVTDTQLSMGDVKTGDPRTHLKNFVEYVNTSTDPAVRDAKFITFNGDLHNGGSLLTIRQNAVANTYRNEAAFILTTLKELRKPIFLTPGNHDGYAATGVAPSAIVTADNTVGTTLTDVVNAASPSPWPDFKVDRYQAYRNAVANSPGGFANDLYVGSFVRRAGERTFGKAFVQEIPREKRNMVLYDGFHQWQRTYGPLNYSFQFKNNHYITLNSFDLRQHVRSGWGMFTVNYGGGISAVQEEWLRRELASHTEDDIVLIAHHDPRGGHKGTDRGYYFAQLAYTNVQQSMANYLLQEIWNPTACNSLPGWARPESTTDEECLHDGLQEWMGPNLKYDCLATEMDESGACKPELFANPLEHAYRFDAYRFIDVLAQTANIRTLLLGHTHMNTLEVLQSGEVLVPVQFTDEQLRGFASLEVQNPARGYAWQSELSGQTPADYDPAALQEAQIEARMKQLRALYEGAARGSSQNLGGDANRELVVLRTTCTAALTTQKNVGGDKAVGFAVLSLFRNADARGQSLPQVNRARYYQSNPSTKFSVLGEIDIPRTQAVGQSAASNPLRALFKFND